MTVAVASVATATATSGATSVVTKPTGTASGDLLVCIYSSYSGSGGTFSAPTGWTQIGSALSATNEQSAVFYKVAGGSEPSTYTFDYTGVTPFFGWAVMYRITGASATPIGASTQLQGSGGASTGTWNAITTTAANAMVFLAATYVANTNVAGTVWNKAGPSGATLQTGLTDNSDTVYAGASTLIQASAGSSGSFTVPLAGAGGDPFQAWTIEIEPAGGGPSTGAGAAAGSATAAATGSTTAKSPGSASGTATVSGAGAAASASQGAASGTGVGTGVSSGSVIPSFVKAGTQVAYVNVSSCSVPYPSSPRSGDLALLQVSTMANSSTPITTPSGWSVLASTTGFNNLQSHYIFYKVLTGSETGSVTVTFSGTTGSNNNGAAQMSYWTGVNTAGTPYEAVTVTNNRNTTSGTGASTVTTGYNELAITFYAVANYVATVDENSSTPSGWTNAYDGPWHVGGTTGAKVTGDFKLQGTPGTVAAPTRTWTNSNVYFSIVNFALLAAPSTATGSAAGSGNATGTGASTAASTASASGSATVTGSGASTGAATGTASGTSTAAAVGGSVATATGVAAGAATATGSSTAILSATGTAQGAASVSGIGLAAVAAAASAAGAATVMGSSGPSVISATGAASGSGVADGAGNALAPAQGQSSGASTVAAIGASTADATATSAGVSNANGVASASVAAVGQADGSATVLGSADESANTVGSSSGQAQVSGISNAIAEASGSAAGSSGASAFGLTVDQGSGSASGSSNVIAFSTVLAEATGSAAGTSTATAVGTRARKVRHQAAFIRVRLAG